MEKRFKDDDDRSRASRHPVEDHERPSLTDIADFVKNTKEVMPVAMIGLFLLAFVSFLYFAKPFVLPIVLSVILNSLLKPVVNVLQKLHVPRWIGSLIVITALISLLWLVISNLVQPAKDWMARAPEDFRKVRQRIEHIIRPAQQLGRQMQQITTPPGQAAQPKVEVSKTDIAGAVVGYARDVLTETVEIIVLLYFLLSAGDLFTQKLVRTLPTLRDKRRAVSIFHELQNNISVYLLTITAINICVGALVGFGVMLMGMPNPLLWGTLAAILNFIPYFGPLTGVVILAVAGLVTFDSVGRGLLPPILYLSVHGVEANFFTPLILGKRLTLNPVVIFASIIFWMWLWGIPGALIAVPLLMMARIICEHFKPLAPLGQFLSDADVDEHPAGA